MREFIIKDYHKEFINNCSVQINTLNESLHACFYDITRTILLLDDKYYHFLIKYGIRIKELHNNDYIGKPLLYTNSEDENLFISEYNYLLLKLETVVNTSKIINKFTFYKSIPSSIYKSILFNSNFEQTKRIIKGDTVTIPKIGDLSIVRVPYDSTKPDWGASNQYKNDLRDKGYTIKNKDNPTGKLWLVDNGLNRNDFAILKWWKHNSRLKNKLQYRFRASVYGNFYPKSLDRKYTIDEIANKTNTGLYDKISHIYRFHYSYTQNNYPFYKFIKNID